MADKPLQKNIPPRLELFSDAVFAIIITIMVLELHAPEGHTFADLYPVLPIFSAYCLSFLIITLDWINHHHLLRALNRTTPKIMWANAHLLFWLSLIPFVTAWLGENLGETIPTFFYALVFFLYSVAYILLRNTIIAAEGNHSPLAKVAHSSWKGTLTLLSNFAAVVMALLFPWLSLLIIVVVAIWWTRPSWLATKYLKL